MQFTPFRQILDSRSQRRIRRAGLSDEMNQYERERRERTKYVKADARPSLEGMELDLVRDAKGGVREDTDATRMTSTRIENLESEISRLREETSRLSHVSTHSAGFANSNDSAAAFSACTPESNNHTNVSSTSPLLECDNDLEFPVIDSPPSLAGGCQNTEASVQANIQDSKRESEMLGLSHDLEAAKQEKKALFDAFRALPCLNVTANNDISRLPSPPPGFLDQVINILTAAVTRASDTADVLDSVKESMTKMGFQGDSAEEAVSRMRGQFRTARLDLERAVPGENPEAGLENGSATLNALVARVKLLVENLEKEHNRHNGSLGREKALKGQFDALLLRYEEASKKIGDLESDISVSSDQAHNATTEVEKLEHSGKEQAVEIEKLNEAMKKYCDESRRLETLVSSLEKENADGRSEHSRELSEMNAKVADGEKACRSSETLVAKHETSIRRLEETICDNRITICDLIAKVEALEDDKQRSIKSQAERHEHELGSLNVRISYLATSLGTAKSEAARLGQQNNRLEELLQLELKAKDDLMREWITNQALSLASAQGTINAERHRERIREESRALSSDDFRSSSNMGSEPITPESMTRFVDVEVGRGKSRRRLDGEIGPEILKEGEVSDEDCYAERQIQNCLNSDIELPSDPVNL